MKSIKQGFTLIELLVVIAIIAILVAFGVSNFVGARQRAKDVQRKAELSELKDALRLYYNDYSTYPSSNGTVLTGDLKGCGTGTPPSTSCAAACSGQFAAGGASPGCSTVYMKLLPSAYTWYYMQVPSGDDYCLYTSLDNTSDKDLTVSHTKCATACSGVSPAPSASSYEVCAD